MLPVPAKVLVPSKLSTLLLARSMVPLLSVSPLVMRCRATELVAMSIRPPRVTPFRKLLALPNTTKSPAPPIVPPVMVLPK